MVVKAIGRFHKGILHCATMLSIRTVHVMGRHMAQIGIIVRIGGIYRIDSVERVCTRIRLQVIVLQIATHKINKLTQDRETREKVD